MSFIKQHLTLKSFDELEKLLVSDETQFCTESIKPTKNATTIEEYFKKRKISIQEKHDFDSIPVINNLAKFLAENYYDCKDFIRYLREIIAEQKFKIDYNLNSLVNVNLNRIIACAEKLNQYGLIANLFHNKFTNILHANLSSAPRVINFINGFYLEIYAKEIVENVLVEFSNRFNLEYELMHNVMINRDGALNELDLVFRLGDKIFWSEIKSGKFSDFDFYRQIGLTLGLNPDRHILLSAEKENEDTDAISWFYQFYVANIKNFKSKLECMINKAIMEDC